MLRNPHLKRLLPCALVLAALSSAIASAQDAAPATGAPAKVAAPAKAPPVPLLWKVSDADNAVYLLGSFEVCQAVMVDQPKVSKAFRNGGAAGYHERCNCLFSGMSRFFGVSYKAHLVQDWLPALDGVV